jgi:hypothetical protein
MKNHYLGVFLIFGCLFCPLRLVRLIGGAPMERMLDSSFFARFIRSCERLGATELSQAFR